MIRPPASEQRRFLRVFGAALRTARQDQGWSQEELAERAGLHRTFVGALERGQRGMNLDRLPALARALGVEPGELVPDREAFAGPTQESDRWDLPQPRTPDLEELLHR